MDGWIEVRNIGAGPAGPSRLLLKCSRLVVGGPPPSGGGCADLPPATTIPLPWVSTPAGLELQVPNLAPAGSAGDHFTATAPFWATLVWKPGTYDFLATADYTNVVAETNEGNNTKMSSLTK